MGTAMRKGLVSNRFAVLLAALVLVPGTVTAAAEEASSDPTEGVPEALERVLYDVFALGQAIGNARCADVTLMNQDAPMTVQPYVGTENVGVEFAGAPEPVGDSVVVMAYPLSCIEYVLGILDPESQDMERLLP